MGFDDGNPQQGKQKNKIGTAIASHARPNKMHQLILTTATALFLALPATAQPIFPAIKGETANGTTVDLPRTDGAAYTIVGLAFSQKASAVLEDWLEPAYLRFVAKHGLFAGEYDVDIYFVPVFVGLNKAAYEPSMKKFRKTTSPEMVDHVLFSKDDMEPLREALEMKDQHSAYFFILDRQGRILHRTAGTYTDEKLEAMEDVLMR
jgi:hypothetical protein